MLREPTVEKLQALKLQAMAQAWTEQQHTAELTSLAFDERFGLLVDAEWLARENKRLGRALRGAKLTQACVEAIDFPPRAWRSASVRFTSASNSVRGNSLSSWLNMLENRGTGEPACVSGVEA